MNVSKRVLLLDKTHRYRREAGLACGATHAVAPEGAQELIDSLTGGRGADVVLEMVGHCQHTINTCMYNFSYNRLQSRSASTVAAYSVTNVCVMKLR